MLNMLSTAKSINGEELPLKEKPQKVIGTAVEFNRMKTWLNERIAKAKKEPLVEIVTLTPVLASLLLDRNPINRPISKRNKDELKQDVSAGRYVFNGESIVISDAGTLNDGQHRCQTVLETGVPIRTVIVFGPKEETRFTVDSGRSKSVSNYLAMKGRKYTNVLGAASGYILLWKESGRIARHDARPSKQAILDAADRFKGIDTSVEFTADAMKSCRSHAVVAFAHYAFWKASSREAADHFVTKLIEGDGLQKGDPILYCRNRLIGMGRGVDAGTRAELIFKCWNAHRLGHGIDHFKLSGGKLPKLER